MDAMAEAAREQKRVAFVVHYADGSSQTLGSKWGYRANDAFIRAEGVPSLVPITILGGWK